MTKVVIIPQQLSIKNSLEFARGLSIVSLGETEYVVDARLLRHCPPFGMLFTSAAMRQYRKRAQVSNSVAGFSIVGTSGKSYPAHMGYWRSFGVPVGNEAGEAPGGVNYLPVSRLHRDELESRSESKGLRLANVLDREASRLAEVLAQNAHESIESTLSYSLRELFRSVFEHSECRELWYCAQHWPTKDLVELAVLDEGRGIFGSLTTNPKYAFIPSEIQAIIWSMKRDVTRAVAPAKLDFDERLLGEKGKTISSDVWNNSGWGLYVLSQLALHAGSILVVSNNAAIFQRS